MQAVSHAGRKGLTAAAIAVLAGGVSASLHLGKLPPAVPALQAGLGISLVQAGLLISLVQVAAMTLGLVAGLAADSLGLRRCMLIGLALLTGASLAGGFVGGSAHAVQWLLMLRGLESVGFLMAVMPGPALIRALVSPDSEKTALRFWGAYMPFGVALALLLGPVTMGAAGWQGWWWALSGVSAAAIAALLWLVPADRHRDGANRADLGAWGPRLMQTLRAPGPWIVGLVFCVYSSQWMAVIGFLPTVYADADAGVPAAWMAVLTAVAAAMNIGGNLSGGYFLQRGVPPARLLRLGFAAMALGGVAAFAQIGQGADALVLPASLRYLAVCLFSLGGGMIPATLFMLAVRVAPGPQTVSSTVGLMQQLSSLGQFLAPPFVAWLAHQMGSWRWTWTFTMACSLTGIALAGFLVRTARR